MNTQDFADNWPTPTAGGQYTRNPKTGALTRAADESLVEAAAPAEPTDKEQP